MSHIKFLAKFRNFNFWQFFNICNFVLSRLWIWCISLVWVVMGRLGVSQNTGVLVVLVTPACPQLNSSLAKPHFKLRYGWVVTAIILCGCNCPISQDFSPSGEQLELRKLAHELKQPTAGCIAIFHKYCCYTKHGSITASLTLQNHWGYVTNVPKYHNAGKLSMD